MRVKFERPFIIYEVESEFRKSCQNPLLTPPKEYIYTIYNLKVTPENIYKTIMLVSGWVMRNWSEPTGLTQEREGSGLGFTWTGQNPLG